MLASIHYHNHSYHLQLWIPLSHIYYPVRHGNFWITRSLSHILLECSHLQCLVIHFDPILVGRRCLHQQLPFLGIHYLGRNFLRCFSGYNYRVDLDHLLLLGKIKSGCLDFSINHCLPCLHFPLCLYNSSLRRMPCLIAKFKLTNNITSK